jgi:cytidylate kinase
MLILFEGPDGSGKTTLIKHIKQKHLKDALICKRNSFKSYNSDVSLYPNNIDLTQSALYDWRFFLEMHKSNFASHMFLCDRSFITQKVYQDITGPDTKTQLLDDTLIALEQEVSTVPHLVVYCKNKKLRNDSDFVFMDGKEDAIVKRYEDFFNNECMLNKVTINTELIDEESSVSVILGAIQAAYNNYVQKSSKRLSIWT